MENLETQLYKENLEQVYEFADHVLSRRNVSKPVFADVKIISEEVKSSLENEPNLAEWVPLEGVQ